MRMSTKYVHVHGLLWAVSIGMSNKILSYSSCVALLSDLEHYEGSFFGEDEMLTSRTCKTRALSSTKPSARCMALATCFNSSMQKRKGWGQRETRMGLMLYLHSSVIQDGSTAHSSNNPRLSVLYRTPYYSVDINSTSLTVAKPPILGDLYS